MHTTELKVRFHEVDAYGHVNHAVYLNYFEVGRIDALEHLGWGLDRLQREGFHIVIVDLRVRFQRPATLGDVLQVGTEMTEARSSSSRWRQRIDRNGQPVASADLRAAITDPEGQPCRMPDGLAAALEPLLVPLGGSQDAE